MDIVRTSGRKWPPAAPEFRAMCLESTRQKYPPMEACMAELTKFIAAGRKDTYNLSHILYHTIVKNMDFYTYKKIEKDWDRIKCFEIAYKATLFQLESGEQLIEIPNPETLIEKAAPSDYQPPVKIATETLSGILSMLNSEGDK